MAEYLLYFTATASVPVTVEADTLADAVDAAYDHLPTGLCHQCAGKIDLNPDWELDDKGAAEDYPGEDFS